jgi:o-succinylbenzoate synthase
MNLHKVKLYQIGLELKTPFVTHAGAVRKRDVILVEVINNDGISGWGECVPFQTPFYTSETIDTAWLMLTKLFIPLLKNNKVNSPKDFHSLVQSFKGHHMAKAAVEGALWDLQAKNKQISLSHLIGGMRNEIDVGVVISLGEDIKEKVEAYERSGYKRYKLKIEMGKEREQVEHLRMLTDMPIMFDGNGMYNEGHLKHLMNLDDLNLLMIEQPFAAGDFYLHKQLQKKMDTPICLDESIESYHDAKQAILFQSASIFNIKISRVGGLTEALHIHELCREHNIPLWSGGMLESGIGRAHNIALASLPQFTIPGDISESKRYYEKDIIYPEVKVKNGKVAVPEEPGIGFDVDVDYIRFLSERTFEYSFEN